MHLFIATAINFIFHSFHFFIFYFRFVVGLSDDAGASANLGMASKLAAAPHLGQYALLDQYVENTLLGTKPDTATPPLFSLQDPNTYRVFMTVWYFDKVCVLCSFFFFSVSIFSLFVIQLIPFTYYSILIILLIITRKLINVK
jgi:hypothetical protein